MMKKLLQLGLLLAFGAAFAPRSEAFAFTIPYVPGPAISVDGYLNEAAWSSGNTLVMHMTDPAEQSVDVTLHVLHDGTWLYVGYDSPVNPGWDVYSLVLVDGNNDGVWNGSPSAPFTDIFYGQPGPGGWGGYFYRIWLPGGGPANVTPAAGTASASAAIPNVTWEYKIKLSDLGVSPGDTIGFGAEIGQDGTAQHALYWPVTSITSHPEGLASATLAWDDTTPPVVESVAANPSVLWPPDNKLVDVTVGANITDDESGVASANLIVTDEYGECSTSVPMIYDSNQNCWTATVPLRAARKGNDMDGRTYTLQVQATDRAGNVSDATLPAATTSVLVPHDQGNGGGHGKKK